MFYFCGTWCHWLWLMRWQYCVALGAQKAGLLSNAGLSSRRSFRWEVRVAINVDFSLAAHAADGRERWLPCKPTSEKGRFDDVSLTPWEWNCVLQQAHVSLPRWVRSVSTLLERVWEEEERGTHHVDTRHHLSSPITPGMEPNCWNHWLFQLKTHLSWQLRRTTAIFSSRPSCP